MASRPDEGSGEDTAPGTDHVAAGPDEVSASRNTAPSQVEESDPSGDRREGLADDMGVSSGRPGRVRGVDEEVTYGASPTHRVVDDVDGEVAPEQSAHDDRPDANPESPGRHESDPDSNPRHGL